jgi:hypothetical protein
MTSIRSQFPQFSADLERNDYYRLEKAVSLMLAGRSQEPLAIQAKSLFDVRGFHIDFEDETLFRMTDWRCEKFIQAGLVEEVIQLILQATYDCSSAAEKSPEQSIGYFETFIFLKHLWTLKDQQPGEVHLDAFHQYLRGYQSSTRHLIKTQRKALRTLPVKPHRLATSVDSLGRTPIDKQIAYILNWSNVLPSHFAEEAEHQASVPIPPSSSLGLTYIPVNRIYSGTNHGEARIYEAMERYLALLNKHKGLLSAKLS